MTEAYHRNPRWQVVAFVILSLTVGYAFHNSTDAQKISCKRSEQGYTAMQKIAVRFTEPTDLVAGASPDLKRQHDLANAKRAADRAFILDSLKKAPKCQS